MNLRPTFDSSYLKHPARLADLIAAIQVLGTYKFSSRTEERWLRRLGRKPVSASTWLEIFKAHPEFFTQDDQGLISLVWRRNKERAYDTHERRLLSNAEAEHMEATDPEPTATRLSRPPLETDEIAKLIDIAVSLHERGIKHQQERRWWYTAIIGAIGATGGLVSILLKM